MLPVDFMIQGKVLALLEDKFLGKLCGDIKSENDCVLCVLVQFFNPQWIELIVQGLLTLTSI